MNVFVLRDNKGRILERNANIGPLFDSAEFIKETTGVDTKITAESLSAVLLEMKESTT
jgi:hypothetical protein